MPDARIAVLVSLAIFITLLASCATGLPLLSISERATAAASKGRGGIPTAPCNGCPIDEGRYHQHAIVEPLQMSRRPPDGQLVRHPRQRPFWQRSQTAGYAGRHRIRAGRIGAS